MNRFENLDSNKREEILRAALSIFADKGYKDASTNKIVDKAGISKGALFNYFTNKKGLYYYLIDYSLEIIKREYIDQIDSTTTDFIQRMENNSKIKYKYLQKHPEVNQFLSTVLYSELKQLPEGYQEKFHLLIQHSTDKINQSEKIDEHLFKKDIHPEKASQIIELSIEGYLNKLANLFKQQPMNGTELDNLWDGFDNHLETLREMFYKTTKEEFE